MFHAELFSSEHLPCPVFNELDKTWRRGHGIQSIMSEITLKCNKNSFCNYTAGVLFPLSSLFAATPKITLKVCASDVFDLQQ